MVVVTLMLVGMVVVGVGGILVGIYLALRGVVILRPTRWVGILMAA